MKEFLISKNNANRKFIKYLIDLMPIAGTGLIYKSLRKKNITLNDKKATGSEALKEGDRVKIFFKEETFLSFCNSDSRSSSYEKLKSLDYSSINIVFEDDKKIIVNKPFGLLSQKSKEFDTSINEIILSYLINNGLSLEDYNEYHPSIVNRLDRNTGGLIIAAKTRESAVSLSKDIKEKNIRRIYNVILHGNFSFSGECAAFYLKDESTNTARLFNNEVEGSSLIKTRFLPLKKCGDLTLTECELLTGKSHQIRAMSAFLGHPVLNDKKYGSKVLDKRILKEKKDILPGQYLFAKKIVFLDGSEISIDLPREFINILEG